MLEHTEKMLGRHLVSDVIPAMFIANLKRIVVVVSSDRLCTS